MFKYTVLTVAIILLVLSSCGPTPKESYTQVSWPDTELIGLEPVDETPDHQVEETYQIYLPMVASSADPLAEMDHELMAAIQLLDPFVSLSLTKNEYVLHDDFDPETVGVNQAVFTELLGLLEATNKRLVEDSELLQAHRQQKLNRQDSFQLLGCGRSGMEFTWYGYKIYLTSREVAGLGIEYGSVSLATRITKANKFIASIWNRIPWAIRRSLDYAWYLMDVYVFWMAAADYRSNGCGIEMFYMDLQVIPFYVRSQS